MAIVRAETAEGFTGLPALRQIGLMIGLAASVALGVAVVMWSQEPNYTLLYGNLDQADSAQVLEALQKANIEYKVDEASGAIMVPSSVVHEARLKLASDGLPKGSGVGFELLDKKQDLGTSQFLEQARYKHAIEIELARSIATMRNVKNARVHLAIPAKTVFVRKKETPSASVVIDAIQGRDLSDEQVASIVHLVAASVPNLNPGKVTVVDQLGNLLTKNMRDDHIALSSSEFEYRQRVEQNYRQRIEDLITPMIGPGRVRAQVVADMDFTFVERTEEKYNRDAAAVRSEHLVEESSNQAGAGAGIPGALSNQPPAGGQLNELNNATDTGGVGRSSRKSTKNYELDKTISHMRTPTGTIRKLSVAVLVDHQVSIDARGKRKTTPLKPEEIDRITALVKESVGFDANRGDTISVTNASFYVPEEPQPLPEPPIWKAPWFQDLIKQVVGGLGVLILIFGVFKPVLQSLTQRGAEERKALAAASNNTPQSGAGGMQDLLPGATPNATMALPEMPGMKDVERQITTAKSIVQDDPARVAQVVRNWVADDA